MNARSRTADEFAEQVRDLIGSRIRWIRGDQELSQEALAFRASVHRTQITLIEHCEGQPTMPSIKAATIGIDIGRLSYGRRPARLGTYASCAGHW